jgi:hypothetical protein
MLLLGVRITLQLYQCLGSHMLWDLSSLDPSTYIIGELSRVFI